MSTPTPLTVFDRSRGQPFQEFMDDSPATYESHPSEATDQWLEAHPLYDWFVAIWQNTSWSARKIEPFVCKHHIDMSEFEPGPFKSYAAFFDRRFLPGKRTFPTNPDEMGAFGEGRYFGWEHVDPGMNFPVKGAALEAKTLLKSQDRVHFPDAGRVVDEARMGHRLWTVNPTALRNQPDILFRNERHIQLLQTENFGLLGFVEVGALSVGRRPSSMRRWIQRRGRAPWLPRSSPAPLPLCPNCQRRSTEVHKNVRHFMRLAIALQYKDLM
jgi:phosphatidylserine decarboxylase